MLVVVRLHLSAARYLCGLLFDFMFRKTEPVVSKSERGHIQVRLLFRETAIPSDDNNLCVLLAASLNTEMLIFLFH